jgi:hypothetical protein
MKIDTSKSIETGISMGCALAMILSYSINKSILWAIVHGLLSWFYVLYFALAY